MNELKLKEFLEVFNNSVIIKFDTDEVWLIKDGQLAVSNLREYKEKLFEYIGGKK